MKERISVREWQELYRNGAFQSSDFETQVRAGWYDWFCCTDALADRLKEIAPIVVGITEPEILDHYSIWFKNNCTFHDLLYDDVRFEPLVGDRCGRYFLVSLDCPYEDRRWTMYTERCGFEKPEFSCEKIQDMVQYINENGKELSAIRTQQMERKSPGREVPIR